MIPNKTIPPSAFPYAYSYSTLIIQYYQQNYKKPTEKDAHTGAIGFEIGRVQQSWHYRVLLLSPLREAEAASSPFTST